MPLWNYRAHSKGDTMGRRSHKSAIYQRVGTQGRLLIHVTPTASDIVFIMHLPCMYRPVKIDKKCDAIQEL